MFHSSILARKPERAVALQSGQLQKTRPLIKNNYQLLDEVEQNIVICRWRADQLFADATIFCENRVQ
jgi:hypothetical protein